MKFIHLSDLHLGKRVNEYSMLEDQTYILDKILQVVDEEEPDGVLIAGDVYDKSVPSTEAVRLFDGFLTQLAAKGRQVFVVSGNHDSPERLSFGARLMEQSGIHLAPVYDGTVEPVTLWDAHGPVHVYMLPFVKPVQVRSVFEDATIGSWTDAVRAAVTAMGFDPACRNVLITHQFVTGVSRTESEELSLGGTDNVDVSVFDGFDYVALGHIHRPQNCGSKRVRYCGTPLKYSFSEAGDVKSVTVVELAKKGALSVRTVPLKPLRDMVELRGAYDQVMKRDFYEHTAYPEDYVHITLTDEEDIPYAVGKLRTVYRNLMKLDYDNARTRNGGFREGAAPIEARAPLELFGGFYALQNNQPMQEKQQTFLKGLIEQIWAEETEGQE